MVVAVLGHCVIVVVVLVTVFGRVAFFVVVEVP